MKLATARSGGVPPSGVVPSDVVSYCTICWMAVMSRAGRQSVSRQAHWVGGSVAGQASFGPTAQGDGGEGAPCGARDMQGAQHAAGLCTTALTHCLAHHDTVASLPRSHNFPALDLQPSPGRCHAKVAGPVRRAMLCKSDGKWVGGQPELASSSAHSKTHQGTTCMQGCCALRQAEGFAHLICQALIQSILRPADGFLLAPACRLKQAHAHVG